MAKKYFFKVLLIPNHWENANENFFNLFFYLSLEGNLDLSLGED